MITMLRW